MKPEKPTIPLMRSVLADLAVESEGATALAMRLSRAFEAQDDPRETAFRRIATPARPAPGERRGMEVE